MKLPRPEMGPEMVLLDVDGTLVDSVPDLAYCVDAIMGTLGLPPRGEDKVRLWVGNGVERLVKRALVDDLEGEPDPELFGRAFPLFLACYQENTCRRSRLFPGVREGLAWLKGQGFKLGCVTNKIERFTLPLLEALGIRDYFQVVVCGDTTPKQKPDPEPLLYAARTLGVSPRHALLVGDSISDVKAARAAGFHVVCVGYGYNHGQDIRQAGCDAVIDRLTDLKDLIEAPARAAC